MKCRQINYEEMAAVQAPQHLSPVCSSKLQSPVCCEDSVQSCSTTSVADNHDDPSLHIAQFNSYIVTEVCGFERHSRRN